MPHMSAYLLQKEAEKRAERALAKFCEEYREHYPDLQKKIATGDPAHEILKAIDSEQVDLVITGTHGRKGLEHTIFGSVAENVVNKASVPVVTMNPDQLQ